MKTLEMLNDYTKDLENRISSLENMRVPGNVFGQLQLLREQIDELKAKINVMTGNSVTMFQVADDRHIEDFKNDEFKRFYEETSLSTNDVKLFIEKEIVGDEVSIPTVSNYLNGKVENVRARNLLGKFLRNEAKKAKTVKK